jgi:hypothetical protein
MKKPTLKTIKHLDYHECAEYIEHKLGYRLRDVQANFDDKGNRIGEYWDFWHFICDTQNPHRGCYIFIGEESKETAEEWQIKIIDAFIEEFGDNKEYWVDW